jgi:transcriptional regulator with XRE-family HTH domain
VEKASPLAKTGKTGAVFAPLASLFALIDDARAHRNISGTALARAAGMNPASYSRLRADAGQVTTETLQRLIAGLIALDAVSETEADAMTARLSDEEAR